MNEQVTNVMFALIRKVVCGMEMPEDIKASITSELLPQLYGLSKAHDMAHIVAQGLSELELLGDDEFSKKFQKQQMLAVYRYQKLNYELEQICQTLEDANIAFVPLKGSVIRKYYPEPWMRTSCDIDVLVHEEDLDRAVAHLQEHLHYTKDDKRNYHDISMFSPNGIHLELHFQINEANTDLDSLLSRVWNYTVSIEGRDEQLLTSEFFVFHQIAHAVHHFIEGGCGVRPFLDIWFLRKKLIYDEQQVMIFCKTCGIAKFYSEMITLSNIWFDSAEHDTVSRQMQSYILFGGVYGTIDNRVAVHQNKKGGKFKYIVSRIFLPYNSLKFMYPILEKHRWLMPFMQIRRWFRLLRKGRMKQSLHELNVNKTMAQEKVSQTAELLSRLGLQ